MRHLALCLIVASMVGPAGIGAQSGTIAGTTATPSPIVTGVVVYLIPAARTPLPPGPPVSAIVDQRDLRFVPRVIAITPGSSVSFPNSDPVMHNVFHPTLSSDGFDLGTYAPGEKRSFTFHQEGAYVIFCHVHPEMVAYVVVIGTPYRAVTDADGRFRVDNVAPGTYRLRTWHRRLQTHEEIVTVSANRVTAVALPLKIGYPIEPRSRSR